mgnify:CR=1 FL=1
MKNKAKTHQSRPQVLRLVCPNTHTNVLLTEAEFGLRTDQFAALAFHGGRLFHSGIGRCELAFTFHESWAHLTLHCREKCVGMAALGWNSSGTSKAIKFMKQLSKITGWNQKWPAIPSQDIPHLPVFLDAAFLKAAAPDEVNLVLNALAVAGISLVQHIRKSTGSIVGPNRLKLPEIRLMMNRQVGLPVSTKTGRQAKRRPNGA